MMKKHKTYFMALIIIGVFIVLTAMSCPTDQRSLMEGTWTLNEVLQDGIPIALTSYYFMGSTTAVATKEFGSETWDYLEKDGSNNTVYSEGGTYTVSEQNNVINLTLTEVNGSSLPNPTTEAIDFTLKDNDHTLELLINRSLPELKEIYSRQ